MTFNPWKLFAKRSKRVNYLFIKKLSDFLRAILGGGPLVPTKNTRLRQETISNWAGYAVLVMSTPFAAWKEYASTASIRRMHQKNKNKMKSILSTFKSTIPRDREKELESSLEDTAACFTDSTT
jgi:hypothetical protein